MSVPVLSFLFLRRSTQLMYVKLPSDINQRTVLLLDPMLATGGSAIRAIEVLLDNGVPEDKIYFLNLMAAPEGVERLATRFPKITIVTTEIDERLNEKKFMVPGVGACGRTGV